MYGVKRESGEGICCGCFSTDRRLSPLANYTLFFGLLDDKQKLEALKNPTMQLCWECNALLRRIKSFQQQVQHAQRLLHALMESEEILPAEGLSQLSTCCKQHYDVIIEDELNDIEESIISVKEEIKVQTDVFNDNLNLDDHCFDTVLEQNSHTELDLFVETTENNLGETVQRKNNKRKLKKGKSVKSKVKKRKVETAPVIKGNRPGLRSWADNIRPLCPNRNNVTKKEFKKPKIKIAKTFQKDFKPSIRRRWLNREDPSANVIIKENVTTDIRDTAAKKIQDEVTDEAEASTDLEPHNVDNGNTKTEIEMDVDNIEQDKYSSESDSKIDDRNNDDPDFEYKNGKNCNNRKNKAVKINKKGVVTSHKWFNIDCLDFNVISQLDEYFTKVDLGTEELEHILQDELSYANEEQPYSCNYCGLCFQMFKTLIMHKRTRHKQAAKCTNPVYMMYRCNICHKIIRKEHTEAHMKYLHRRRYSCKECDKKFWSLEEGRSHFKECHKQILNCGLCKHIAYSKKAKEAHIRDCHTVVSCDICGKKASGIKYLNMHRRRHASDGSTPEQRYCLPCGKQFPTVRIYQQHLKYSMTHSGKTPERIPCTECGKVMADKASLRAHYDRFHSDKTRFQCEHCDKYYARKSGLCVHIDSVHLKKRPPKDKLCTMCGRGFSFLRTLEFHMRTHTGERPHACPHCPAAFAQPYPLRKHLESQHGEAPSAPVVLKGGPKATGLKAQSHNEAE